MTLGEKLSRLRRENNYTQEELAELLGVSRQSVSKWESDIAYPETDKLKKISKLFDCSLDYLLNDNLEEKNSTNHEKTLFEELQSTVKKQFRERKSEKTVLGMPLYHIGRNAHGFVAIGLKARGVISIGFISRGIVSLGLLSLGVISIGLLALGILAAGTFSLGLMAFGAIALGIMAAGAVSVGVVSAGALSVGCFSAGALSVGRYAAIGDQAHGMIAIGKTVAQGSLYSHIGDTSTANIEEITKCLDSCVPQWLSWAKEIFKIFI